MHGLKVSVSFCPCPRERRSVLDEACNTICHVFVGGPFLATLSHSLRAFHRQMDHFTQKDLSRIFTLFAKAKKKEIRNPIKGSQQANEA